MDRQETRELIAETISSEVRKIVKETHEGRRELLGRAAVLGMEDSAREMFKQGATEHEVATALLDSLPNRAGDSGNTTARSPYRRVQEIPDDVFARAINNPSLYSFADDGGVARPGDTTRQHTRTEGNAPNRKVKDVPDDVFARMINNPSISFR